MSEPLIEPDDLGTYLNDSSINEDRATLCIAQAQALCESIVSPLPPVAVVVVTRVAGRGYVTTTSPRQAQIAGSGSPFGAQAGAMGGIWLSRADKADLRRMAGGGGAFTIDLLPAGYVAPINPVHDDGWDLIP